jgi:3-deoxy-7-phosphoheptulonate synthase
MIIIMHGTSPEKEIARVMQTLKEWGYDVRRVSASGRIILGVSGEGSMHEVLNIKNDCIEKIVKVTTPYRLARRSDPLQKTEIKVKDVVIGGRDLLVIAGPCAVESREQIAGVASALGGMGIRVLRGGAFKLRTSPYAFQGLEEQGLAYLREAADACNMLAVSEITDCGMMDAMVRYCDIIMVGTRSMHNFRLLKELGRIDKPILLKRGFAATYEEWLLAAEYILSCGNPRVILCERGIKTFEKYTRNTLDIAAVPAIKKLSHLPIIVDPSHATGMADLVAPLATAAVAAGADGLMVEVHTEPESALSDGYQSLGLDDFKALITQVTAVAAAVNRRIS